MVSVEELVGGLISAGVLAVQVAFGALLHALRYAFGGVRR